MKGLDFLSNLWGWNTGSFSETSGFRCIRCGDEFERDYKICPSCETRFVAPIEEDE